MFSISPSNGGREQLGGERGKYGDWEMRRVRYEPYGVRGGVGEETYVCQLSSHSVLSFISVVLTNHLLNLLLLSTYSSVGFTLSGMDIVAGLLVS
jgi:hypothetical protein